MPTDPSDPSSPKSSTRLYQTTSDAPKGGGGGLFAVILLLVLLGGGAAYYFVLYKPAAAAAPTAGAPPAAAPAKRSPTPDTSGNPTYNNAQRTQYIRQADEAFIVSSDAKKGAFLTTFNALMVAGGFTASGLTSKEAIAARRDLVAKCQAANDDYEAFTKTQVETYKTELKKTPLIPNDVDLVLSDFEFKAMTEKNLQLRDLQRQSLKTGDDILAYLDKTYGSWSLNEKQHLVFKAGAGAQFSALGKAYNDQSTAITQLQAEIKAATNPNGAPAASSPTAPPASPLAGTAPVPPTAAPAVSATP